MDFSKLSQNNWIAAGGGLLTFIAGFLPWFSWGDDSLSGLGLDLSVNQSGFDAGLFAILGILLCVAAAVILVLKVMDIQDVNASNLSAEQIAMILAAVGTLFILLRILIAPGGGFNISASRAWGGFLAFIAAGATTAGAFLSAQDKGIGIPSADDFTGGGGGGGNSGGTPSTF